MAGLKRASCDVELNGTPEWVHLLPLGKMTGRDGRAFDLADPAALVLAFQSSGVDLPVDYEHQNDRPEAKLRGPVPAAGWIKDLRHDAQGLWARVEWPATASEMIANREYRYVSPSFMFHPATKQIVKLNGAGLVHNPNLHLTALASEETDMADDDFTAEIAKLLGLDEASDAKSILDALRAKLKDGGASDPTKYVPIEAVQDMMQKGAVQSAQMTETRASQKVQDAMAKGYLSPGMTTWALQLCLQSEQRFDEFISSAVPVYAHLTQQIIPSGPPPSAQTQQGPKLKTAQAKPWPSVPSLG